VVISDQEKKNAWISFATGAISGSSANKTASFEDVIDDSAELADAMLEEYLARFDPNYKPDEGGDDEEEEEEEERPRRKTGRKHRR
jgi:hypothetical protein